MKWYVEGLIALGVAVVIYAAPKLNEKFGWVKGKLEAGRDIPAGYGDEDKENIGGAQDAKWGHWLGNEEFFGSERTKGAESGPFGYNEDEAGQFRTPFQTAWTRHEAGEFLFMPARHNQREFQQLKERDRIHEKEIEKQETDRVKHRRPFGVVDWLEQLFSGVGAAVFSEPQGARDLQSDTLPDSQQSLTRPSEENPPMVAVPTVLSGYAPRSMHQSGSYMKEQAVEIGDSWLAEPGMEQDKKTRVGFYAPSYNHFGDSKTVVDRGKLDQETIEEHE